MNYIYRQHVIGKVHNKTTPNRFFPHIYERLNIKKYMHYVFLFTPSIVRYLNDDISFVDVVVLYSLYMAHLNGCMVSSCTCMMYVLQVVSHKYSHQGCHEAMMS